MSKNIIPEEEDMYCPECGTCGFIGCCGVDGWLEKHVRGKTNCQEESNMIEEIKIYCDESGCDDCIKEAKQEAYREVIAKAVRIVNSLPAYPESDDTVLVDKAIKKIKSLEGGKK